MTDRFIVKFVEKCFLKIVKIISSGLIKFYLCQFGCSLFCAFHKWTDSLLYAAFHPGRPITANVDYFCQIAKSFDQIDWFANCLEKTILARRMLLAEPTNTLKLK